MFADYNRYPYEKIIDHRDRRRRHGRNEMPIRIDYYGNYIATDPDTKKKDWVVSDINGEQEAVSSRTGCAGVYQLDNSPGQDLLAGGEQISIDKSCKESDIGGSHIWTDLIGISFGLLVLYVPDRDLKEIEKL